MTFVEFLSQPVWHRFGLTLVHFLWQGLAIAVFTALFVRVFRLKRGHGRYAAYLLAFAGIIISPMVTFAVIDISTYSNAGIAGEAEFFGKFAGSSNENPEVISILPQSDTLSFEESYILPALNLFTERLSGRLDTLIPWILSVWMAGVLVLSIRLFAGFAGIYRWRKDLRPLPERLSQRASVLCKGLGMRQFSQVFISANTAQAMAVGYLRPIILIPASFLTQMNPEMLEAVIAHELAHIRRFDLWVNLVQRVIETLLFYHPAVWWLSNHIRSERELCCDELAVKATGEPLIYAKTLESVSSRRFTANKLFLATGLARSSRPTLGRVRHVLGLAPAHGNNPHWAAGIVIAVFLAALAIPATLALSSKKDKRQEEVDSGCLARHFVRLVIDDENDRMTFQGKQTNWDELPSLLEKVPYRDSTVFEVGFTDFPQNPGNAEKLREWMRNNPGWQKAAGLTEKYGFEYLSFVGRHKIGAVAGGTRNHLVGSMELNKLIGVDLSSAEKTPLVHFNTIEFSKDKAVINAWVTSYPKSKWDIEIAFLDPEMERLDYVFKNYENSGVIKGTWSVRDRETIEVDISKIKNFGKAKYFELSIKQSEKRDRQIAGSKNGIDIKPGDLKLHFDSKRKVYSLVVSIHNDSSTKIPEFKLRFYKGNPVNNLDEAGNLHSGWHNAGPIEPGKRWNERTRDFYMPDGKYEFGVVLDYDNRISEVDESNNTRLTTVLVEDGQIKYVKPANQNDLNNNRVNVYQAGQNITDSVKNPDMLKALAKEQFDKLCKADYEKILSHYDEQTGRWRRNGWKKLGLDYMVHANQPEFAVWVCRTFRDNPVKSVELGEVFLSDRKILKKTKAPAVPYRLVLQDGGVLEGDLYFVYRDSSKKWQAAVGIDWHLQNEPVSRHVSEINMSSKDGHGNITNKKMIVPGECVGNYTFDMSKDDVLKILGQPKFIFYGDQRYTLDNLPKTYYMVFNDISFRILDNSVKEITALSPFYRFACGLGVGDSEQKVKQVFGEKYSLKKTGMKDFLAYKDKGLVFEIDKHERTVMEIGVLQITPDNQE